MTFHAEQEGNEGRLSQSRLKQIVADFGGGKLIADIYPVTAVQQGMLFHSLQEGHGTSYVLSFNFRLSGVLDKECMNKAWSQAMNRFDAFRTSFHALDLTSPIQVVAKQIEFSFIEEDWRGRSQNEINTEIKRLQGLDSLSDLDVGVAPISSGYLIQTAPKEHYIFWYVHHLIFDGWSIPNFLNALIAEYKFLADGVPLPNIPAGRYKDYVSWSRKQDKKEQKAFWENKFESLDSPTGVGVAASAHVSRHLKAGRNVFETIIDVDSDLLQRFCAERKLTKNVVLQAAWAFLLSRYGGKNDVQYGIVVSGRPAHIANIQNQVGLFINTVPQRIVFEPDMYVSDFIGEVSSRQFELIEHQASQLIDIQSWVGFKIQDDLLQSSINFLNYPIESFENLSFSKSLKIDNIRRAENITVPVALSFRELSGGLHCYINFDGSRFEDSVIENIPTHLTRIVNQFLSNPKCKLHDLEILSESELANILYDWNDTHRDLEDGYRPVNQHISAIATSFPDQIALAFGDENLSYRELEERSNRLAHRLIALGIGPEKIVGLCCDRSIEMFVGLIAILKAGAAYLPLDPLYPVERLSYMASDAGLDVILVQERYEALAGSLGNVSHVLNLDALDNSSFDIDLPNVVLSESNVAYVIYTSGSTGRPKGTLVQHQSLTSFAAWMRKNYELSPEDNVLHNASISFDASVRAIFGALSSGATLVIMPPDGAGDPEVLADVITRENVSFAHFVPSMMEAFLQSDEAPALGGIKNVALGGELFTPDIYRKMRQHSSHNIFNNYGPTEATVNVATNRLVGDYDYIPIGRPNDNVKLYVLDECLNPVPVGVVGELHIAGTCLARGYINQPALTAKSFIANPFGSGERLYKSGDLVRLLANGEIDYVGRKDNQIKIRGYRVELGEITSVLAAHPDVLQAAVIVEENDGDDRLVGYYVANDDAVIEQTELKSFLSERILNHMVPTVLFSVPLMPLTVNGKLDRAALSSMVAGQGEREATAPNTETEKRIFDIWSSILGKTNFGIHDNFFEIGGDSIKSIQVVSRARKAGISLKVKDTFECPTIAELSVKSDISKSTQPVARTKISGSFDSDIIFAPIQKRFLDRHGATSDHYNFSLLIDTHVSLNPQILNLAICEVISHHDYMRVAFKQGAGGYHKVLPKPYSTDVVTLHDLSDMKYSDAVSQMEHLLEVTQTELDLSEGRNISILLFDFGAGHPQKMALTMHHLYSDGYSARLIFEDLWSAYQQLEVGQSVGLAPKSMAFGAWTHHIKQYAGSDYHKTALNYWKALENTSFDVLPRDDHNADTTHKKTNIQKASLTHSETEELLRAAALNTGSGINGILLTALSESIDKWTGSSRKLVSLEGHGRHVFDPDIDISRTVGWFTARYPVSLDVDASDSLLQRLRFMTERLDTLPSGGVDFGIAQTFGEPLKIEPPEISFNYLGQFSEAAFGGAPFRVSDEIFPNQRSPESQRDYALNITCVISSGTFTLYVDTAEAEFNSTNIDTFMTIFLKGLREVVLVCDEAANYLSISDFRGANLSIGDLDHIAALFGGGEAIEDIYPATPLQDGLLFHSLSSPNSSTYMISIGWRFIGDFDIEAFRQAWAHSVQKFEILRTAFIANPGDSRTMQVVLKAVTVSIEEVDWRGEEPTAVDQKFETLKKELRMRDFDYSAPPLMNLTVVRVGPEEYRVIWTKHHLIMDGWSLPIILHETLTAYKAYSCGDTVSDTPSPKFKDFVYWLQEQDQEALSEFWSNHLSGFTETTPLGIDHLESPEIHSGDRHITRHFPLKIDIDQALSFIRDQKITLNTLMTAAWGVILSTYTHLDDVVFGMTVSGRPAELDDVESRVGLFINTLPQRVVIKAEETISAFLSRLNANSFEMIENQGATLTSIASATELPSSMPLFESVMVLQNYPQDQLKEIFDGASLKIENIDVTERPHYPLHLEFAQTKASLSLNVTFDQTRFENYVIENLGQHVEKVLRDLMEGEALLVGDISLLSEAEDERLRGVAKGEVSTVDETHVFIDRFSDMANRKSEEIAILTQDQAVSFGDLEVQSNRFANLLLKKGFLKQSVIGILAPRGVDFTLYMLAVLKAGSAFLPLDPSYPGDRLFEMTSSAGVKHLLIGEGIDISQYDFGTDITLHLHEDFASEAGLMPSTRPDIDLLGLDAAYVMFTSGSTGTPKGVVTHHTAMLNRILNQSVIDDIDDSSVFVQKASLGFVDSIYELTCPLMLGHRLVIVPDELVLNVYRFVDVLKETGASHLVSVPSLAKAMLETGALGNLLKIRSWTLGGEATRSSLLKKLKETLPNCRFVNNYGSTEVSDAATIAVLGENHSYDVSIGAPISNVSAYILTPNFDVLPRGVVGELYIGGRGVTRGYLGDVGSTAKKFLADPYSTVGERMYRTGDMAYRDEDYRIKFAGRTDRQVKIRGVRIELGEIEAQLVAVSGIRECAVRTHETGQGAVVVAYYVEDYSADITDNDLRRALERKLPRYWIPNHFIRLDELPTTPSGKVNRTALEFDKTLLKARDIVEAETEVEVLTCNAVAKVLDRNTVGLNDNFFDLGGHSLLAIQLIGAVRNTFKVELPITGIFNVSTIGDICQEIEALMAEPAQKISSSLTKQDRPEHVPLSFGQERFYFLDKLGYASVSSNIPGALKIQGPLNVEALKLSFKTIIERHEILRTSFGEEKGEAYQRILPVSEFNLEELDVSALSEEDRSKKIASLTNEEISFAFDLNASVPLRAILIKVTEKDFILLQTIHHILIDEWSMSILMKEITDCYRDILLGIKPKDLSQDIQYADFAIWQRSAEYNDLIDEQLASWKEKLSGVPQVLNFPTDTERPPVANFTADTVPIEISQQTSNMLKGLAKSEGLTLFMLLIAAYQMLLGRWSDQEEFIVGFPVAGRKDTSAESMIGCFINLIPMAVNLSGKLTLREYLQSVKKETLFAYSNQDLPFERLVSGVDPVRDMSRQPLFQALLTFQNVPKMDFNIEGAQLEGMRLTQAEAKYDLSLVLSEVDDQITGRMEYAAELFESATIERFVKHLEVLLSVFSENLDQPIDQISFLSNNEREDVVVNWNSTDKTYLPECFLHAYFEASADAYPDTTALLFGQDSMSYSELDKRANKVAAFLTEQGVRAESVVAICTKHSIEMMINILGILKAGGAYMPINPDHPQNRLEYMIEDSGADILLYQDGQTFEFDIERNLKSFKFSEIISKSIGFSDVRPTPSVFLNNLAYIIYTSGSTGRPKGVEVSHYNVARYLNYAADIYGARHGTINPVNTSIGFDATVASLWTSLRAGSTVHLVTEESPVPELQQGLDSETYQGILKVTPQQMYLLNPPEKRGAKKPSLFIIGGDELHAEGLDAWRSMCPEVTLLNEYGPTETSVGCMAHIISDVDPNRGSVSIGGPAPNVRIYILDENLAPQPVGITGEMVIGGDQVVRGYRGKAGLTATRFIADPFSGKPGSRLYRTGDLARWRPDGSMEFLGRIDNQLKIRGFRIEADEIASVLRAHGSVEDTLIMAHQFAPGNKAIIAYVVPIADANFDADELRTHLRERLPEYMIPALFIELEKFPLTSSAKIDRHALPKPIFASQSRKFQEPITETEKLIESIWSDILDLKKIGRLDNFFEIGGDSIKALKILSQLNEKMNTDLPLRLLFEEPFLDSLARKVDILKEQADVMTTSDVFSPLIPLFDKGTKFPIFCIHSAVGLSLGYSGLGVSMGSHHPIYGLQATKFVDGQSFYKSLRDMAEDYFSLIQSIQAEGPYHLIGYSFGGNVAYEIAKFAKEAGHEIGLLCLGDASPVDMNAKQALELEDPQLARNLVTYLGLKTPLFLYDDTLDVVKLVDFLVAEERLPEAARHGNQKMLLNMYKQIIKLASSFSHEGYDGDILYLKATKDSSNAAEDWMNYTNGAVNVFDIDCKHSELFSISTNFEISSILKRFLGETT